MRNKAFIVFCLCALLFHQAKAQELLNYPLDTVNGEEVYQYEVERSIGLYRIGVNFNVTQAEIIRLNPQLRERGLHYGETLLIPTGRPVVIESKPVVVETVITERVVIEPTPQESAPAPVVSETPDTAEVVATSEMPAVQVVQDGRPVVEIALLLPFESQQTKRSGNADRMMEFYQGALLALYEVQNDSIRYRLRVYDSERSERRVRALCDTTELDSVQAVMGLVYPIQIERMAEWCELHQVPLLLPFNDDNELSNRPQLLQFNANDRQEADSLCQWMLRKDSIHCVAIEVRDAEQAEYIRTLRRQMKAHEIAYSGLPLHDLLVDSAAYALDSARENIIILHSDRYQPVRLLIPHLIKLQQAGYRIRIVSQYSWQKENIALPQVFTSMFTSEAPREAYEALWNRYFSDAHVSDSPRYDILGYDLMRAMIAWLQGTKEIHGLQSDIRWTQVENGGWQNAEVRVVEK